MKILYNSTTDKKDVVKANNSVDTVKDILNKPFVCTGIIIFEKDTTDEDSGEVKTNTVIAFKTDEGFVTSISPTVLSSTEAITSAYSEDEITSGIEMVVKSKKSKADRDFYYIDLV